MQLGRRKLVQDQHGVGASEQGSMDHVVIELGVLQLGPIGHELSVVLLQHANGVQLHHLLLASQWPSHSAVVAATFPLGARFSSDNVLHFLVPNIGELCLVESSS